MKGRPRSPKSLQAAMKTQCNQRKKKLTHKPDKDKQHIIQLISSIKKKKKDTGGFISKAERDSQTQKTNLGLAKEKGGWGEE